VMANLYRQYGASVIFISVVGPWTGPDGKPTSAADAVDFTNRYGVSWTSVYDSSGTVFSNWGVNSVPMFFIVGKSGTVSDTFSGEQTYNDLSSAINNAT
jgi:hypothetical protein